MCFTVVLCLQVTLRLPFFDHLNMECEKALLTSSQRLAIMGDFNSDPTFTSSPQAKFLRSFINQFNLHELFFFKFFFLLLYGVNTPKAFW